jgi:hypothetical protein
MKEMVQHVGYAPITAKAKLWAKTLGGTGAANAAAIHGDGTGKPTLTAAEGSALDDRLGISFKGLDVLMEALLGATTQHLVGFPGSSLTHWVFGLGTLPYSDHQCVTHRNTASIDSCMLVTKTRYWDSHTKYGYPVHRADLPEQLNAMYMYWCPPASGQSCNDHDSPCALPYPAKLPAWTSGDHRKRAWNAQDWQRYRSNTTRHERGEWQQDPGNIPPLK